MMRKLLLLLLLTTACGPSFAALSGTDADTDIVAAAAPMPPTYTFATNVSVGDALIFGVLEVSAESTTITAADIAGTVNATGWQLLSGPQDSATGTFRSWVFGKISTGAGTETLTVTRTGTPNGAFGGTIIKTDGAAITFGQIAAIVDSTATTTHTSNTISTSNVGAVIGVFIMQSDADFTATTGTDLANENFRIHFPFLAYASGGVKGVAGTTPGNAAAHLHMVELIEGTPASGALLRRRRQ
jgi:hypothetical protein